MANSAVAFMKQLWLTDCKSLEETLLNPKCSTHSDNRLSIKIAALRQSFGQGSARITAILSMRTTGQKKKKKFADQLRCIDTDTMIVDPMTTVMDKVKLLTAMETNVLDVEQPLDSILKKRAKQLQRRKVIPELDMQNDVQQNTH